MAKKQAPTKTRKPAAALQSPRLRVDSTIREKLAELRAEPLTAESAAWIAALEWVLLQLEANR